MPSDITLWLFDTSSLQGEIPVQWLERLSTAEQQRAATLKHSTRRNNYIASHALAYQALHKHCGARIKNFSIASEGAPLLIHQATQEKSPAHLSLSHSGNYILCAISDADTVIGCDIEKHQPRTNSLAIAKQFFTEEEYQQLKQLDDNNQTDELQQQFYRMWTCKEAWLKAQGLGIANGLKKIAIQQNGFTFSDATSNTQRWLLARHETSNYTLAISIGWENNDPANYKVSVDQLTWTDEQFQIDESRKKELVWLLGNEPANRMHP